MADECKGKDSWPELVGMKGEDAVAIIEKENPYVDAFTLPEKAMVTMEFLCTRVRVRVNTYGIVTKVPRIG